MHLIIWNLLQIQLWVKFDLTTNAKLSKAPFKIKQFHRIKYDRPTTTKSDEQSQEEEKIKSRFHGKGKKLRLIIENNHFYSDKLG
ncbi:hypothetical protein JHK86_045002 [Glycine max]|nr:hypothetical protein JHK86_045002 [Glycine max]